ncbi:MAG: hypothetical protein WCK21_08345, partial [Actinomycetota bacterium]
PIGAGRTASPVDAITHKAVPPPTPAVPASGQPILAGRLPRIADTPSTQPPPATITAIPPPKGVSVEPCVLAPGTCAGEPGVVRDERVTAQIAPAPLRVSTPFGASGDVASLCSTIEGGTAPDGFLAAAIRPTVAVTVNQPSTLALSGAWSDGSELKKLTMVTSPAHDREWQQQWDQQHVQRDVLACLTLPLDEVRAHAVGGTASLRVDILAISASGRAQSTSQVTLNIPIDDPDPLFADRVTITDAGERHAADGLLYPTVHVHYAFFTDALVPAASGLTPATMHVFDSHAFVDGADCAGWAGNRLGRDRTQGADYSVATEQRTIAGHTHPLTVVDADVRLDPSVPGGWQGFLCVRLTVSDASATKAFTLAVQGAPVRSPRTASYEIGALLDDAAFPADWQLRLMWSASDHTLCSPAVLASGGGATAAGATCTTPARLVPDGIVMSFVAVDPRGADHPALFLRVPVNLAYCNPDDPNLVQVDGCDTGFDQPLYLAYGLPNGGTQQVHVVVHVGRNAAPGSTAQDPSNAWRIGVSQTFTH